MYKRRREKPQKPHAHSTHSRIQRLNPHKAISVRFRTRTKQQQKNVYSDSKMSENACCGCRSFLFRQKYHHRMRFLGVGAVVSLAPIAEQRVVKAKSLLTPPAFVYFIHLPYESHSPATNYIAGGRSFSFFNLHAMRLGVIIDFSISSSSSSSFDR